MKSNFDPSLHQGSRKPALNDWEDQRSRQPEPVAAIVDRLIARMGSVSGPASGLDGCWASIVGDELAAVSRPGRCAQGCLTVLANNGATATRLRLLSNHILGNVEERLGEGTVTTIRFRVDRGT